MCQFLFVSIMLGAGDGTFTESVTWAVMNVVGIEIADTDIAAETSELTRAQILQQAEVSVLTQANTSAQIALALLNF